MIKLILFGALVANVILLASPTDTDCDDGNNPPPPPPCDDGKKTPPPKKCKGKNERYDTCPNQICEPRTCAELGFPLKCSTVSQDQEESECIPDCICIDGYVRNKKGNCIPVDKCPSCGGDSDATSGCGINCGRLCSNYQVKNPVCPKLCKFNSCDCKVGFVYDENIKKCVKPCDCTPTCGNNEQYSECTNGGCFGARNCTEIGRPRICVDIKKDECEKGCICIEGFLRDCNGTCIPQDQCPSKCKGKNERYDPCPNQICKPKTCAELGFPLKCSTVSQDEGESECRPGCICKDGYVRDKKGNCIPENKCPSCGGDSNATPGCGINCGRLCSNYQVKNPVCNKLCRFNSCDCKVGFVYDENMKKCVKPCDCTPTCGDNEQYSECTNGGCFGPRNCTEIGRPRICVDITKDSCEKGCICKEGFLRDCNGTCISQDQCPSTKCGPNEQYDCCPVTCPPQTCEVYNSGIKYPCPLQPNPPNCDGQCVCKPGFYRNQLQNCISAENCKKCLGPNEYFACGGACDNVCATLDQQSQDNCPIVNIKCNEMCYCDKGYARDDKDICIPIKDCPCK